MPFDPAPREVKVGEFQDVADAIMRGCRMTRESHRCNEAYSEDAGSIIRACVWGAYCVGEAESTRTGTALSIDTTRFWRTGTSYERFYGTHPVDDYERNGLTREQIAARIAAL